MPQKMFSVHCALSMHVHMLHDWSDHIRKNVDVFQMLFVASTTEALHLSLLFCLQRCYSWYLVHKYLRGSYHWILLAGLVILLGMCVDAPSSVKIIQISLLKIRGNPSTLQILRLIGNIIKYIYIYISSTKFSLELMNQ